VDVITTALAAIDAGGARILKAGELEQFLAPLVRPFAHFSDAKDSADAKAMWSNKNKNRREPENREQ